MDNTKNRTTKTPEQIANELKPAEVQEQKEFEAEQKRVQERHGVAVAYRLKVGDAIAWVKKPSRADVAMCRSLGEGDEIKIKELLLDAVWLEGDERIRKDDDYFFNAFPLLDNLIETKAAELKKS